MARMTAPVLDPVDQSEEARSRSWMVTVFDNATNTYAEVIGILMQATHCDFDEAWMETWEVDHLGKSVVHVSKREECEIVSKVIAEIGIRVEVSEA